MEYRSWRGWCLCDLGGGFPCDAVAVEAPFAPLCLTVRRDTLRSRGCFAVTSIDEALEPEGSSALLPAAPAQAAETLRRAVAQHGATVLNTAFSRCYDWLCAMHLQKKPRVTLVGLGDVGGTLLTALKLLGGAFDRLAIYDPNEALCRRYELELNQVLSLDGAPLAPVERCAPDALFDCDLFLFTASRGVPALGADVGDVRMAQFARNREMLRSYAQQARQARFTGLFCQISDPVDLLCRSVFLDSNQDANGRFDACGLLPEQVRGFGLGVMAARAADMARREGIDFSSGRLYGPHGKQLIVANDPQNYDPALSAHLSELTADANMRVRALGFKPYLAPALSSAAVSLLRLLRGEECYSAVPMRGAYFGCLSRTTPQGILTRREALHPLLVARIDRVLEDLEGVCYD